MKDYNSYLLNSNYWRIYILIVELHIYVYITCLICVLLRVQTNDFYVKLLKDVSASEISISVKLEWIIFDNLISKKQKNVNILFFT